MWSRGPVVLTECPVSYITPESAMALDEHHAWRLGGKGDLRGFPSKSVEAFAVLEGELLRENKDGQR